MRRYDVGPRSNAPRDELFGVDLYVVPLSEELQTRRASRLRWRVTAFTPSLAECLARQLARELGADPAATAGTQLTRLPGYCYHKRSPPHFVDEVYDVPVTPLAPVDFPAPPFGPPRNPLPSLRRRGFANADLIARVQRYVDRVPHAVAGEHGASRPSSWRAHSFEGSDSRTPKPWRA